jgi:hypothetical protein
LYFVRKVKSAKQGEKVLSRYNNNQMLLEKLCLQKWRKKKTEFKLHPSACTSHISSEAQLIITYEAIPTTKISSYLKF